MDCTYCNGSGSLFEGGGMGRDPRDGYMADYVPCDRCGGEGVTETQTEQESEHSPEGAPPASASDVEPPQRR